MTQGLALENPPTSVLYDVFQDTANVLTGLYLQRQREASDQSAADRWWAKVMDLREENQSVPYGDRATLVDCVTRWRHEAADRAHERQR